MKNIIHKLYRVIVYFFVGGQLSQQDYLRNIKIYKVLARIIIGFWITVLVCDANYHISSWTTSIVKVISEPAPIATQRPTPAVTRPTTNLDKKCSECIAKNCYDEIVTYSNIDNCIKSSVCFKFCKAPNVNECENNCAKNITYECGKASREVVLCQSALCRSECFEYE